MLVLGDEEDNDLLGEEDSGVHATLLSKISELIDLSMTFVDCLTTPINIEALGEQKF